MKEEEKIDGKKDRLLTVLQLATLLEVNPVSVYKLAKAGALPCIRFSPRRLRFKETDVMAYIESHQVRQ